MTARSEGRPRIVLATRVFAPEGNAAAIRLGSLAKALVERGAEVTVVTTIPTRRFRGIADTTGADIRRWPVLRDRGGNVRGYIQYLSFDVPLLFRLLFRRFDAVVSEAPPTTGLVSSLVATIHRRPLAYYAADVLTDGTAAVGAPRPVIAAVKLLERMVLRRAACVLSVVPEVTRRLVELGADPARVVTIGHGIDTEVFQPGVEPMASASPYFLYAGTMSEVHRPQVFVRAFARIASGHPDLRLKFIGQGVYVPELRALAEELVPGRVDFDGLQPPTEIARWLRGAVASLVSLAPGTGYDFAHPTKAYAAAATGTPVVFAGPRGFGRIVEENGLGVAVDHEVDRVAEAMRTVLDEHESGRSERMRPSRASWAEDVASLRRIGGLGADAIMRTIRRKSGEDETRES